MLVAGVSEWRLAKAMPEIRFAVLAESRRRPKLVPPLSREESLSKKDEVLEEENEVSLKEDEVLEVRYFVQKLDGGDGHETSRATLSLSHRITC